MLLVAVHLRGAQTVTGITYNSDAMTHVATAIQSAGVLRTEIWRLVNPDSGANSVLVTLSAAIDSSLGGSAMSFTGVDQTTPIGATATAGPDTGTSVSTNLTTAQNNSWVVDAVTHRNDIDITAGGSQSNVLEHNNGTSTIGGMSTRLAPTAGSYAMSWADGADHQWRHVLLELRDAAGAPPVVNMRRGGMFFGS